MKTNYKRRKEQARAEAIEWQINANPYKPPISWTGYIEQIEHFYRLAKRYGLIKEFRENGII